MAITFEPPSTSSGPDPRQGDSPPKHKSIEELFASPTAQLPPRRGWQDRYQQHIWIGLISVLVIVLALSPIVLGFLSRPAAPATTPTAAPPTTVSVTASEFKFSPASIQMPAGQKVSITLQNTGVVEHDITVANTGFTLLAKSGQTATADFTFDKAGVFEFFCSIPGHKDAGMKGTFTVLDTQAGAQPAAAAPQAHDMSGMAGMAMTSTADIKSLPADLKPLSAPQVAPPITRNQPAYVKFDLRTSKVTAQLADGVAYEYWTFNNTVPGPMLRVREGDTVEISLTNSPDAGVTHSIDLHAVTGPGGGAKVMQIPPGETGSFKFQALNPGVYVYHCATPMVAQHIANGMYGLVVVEPKQGLPAVDHEYYLMQGDFYLRGQRGDQGLRAFDMNKMLDERPDYVLFNGAVGATTGANALKARVGETIRVFFGDGGPNLTSSFHIIGMVLDRVYPEGALANPLTNVQTTHVPSGGATVAEVTARVPGTYTIVDHSLGRLEKGAAGQIVVEGPDNPEIFQSIVPGTGGGGGH